MAQNFDRFLLTRANENRAALTAAGYTKGYGHYMKCDSIHDPNQVFLLGQTTTQQPFRNNPAWVQGDAESLKLTSYPLRKSADNSYVRETAGPGDYVYMDMQDAGWRGFLRDRIHGFWNADNNWEYLWVDNLHIKFTAATGIDVNTVEYGNADTEAVSQIYRNFISWIKDNITTPRNKWIAGNVQGEVLSRWKPTVDLLDHVMIEFFALQSSGTTGPKAHGDWKRDVDKAEYALAQGIQTLCVGHFVATDAAVGNATELARLQFAVASLLLVAAPLAGFRAGKDYGNAYHFALLNDVQALGAPLGRYFETTPGSQIYRRNYWGGLVEVNAGAGTSSITYTTPSGLNWPWLARQIARSSRVGQNVDLKIYSHAVNAGSLLFSAVLPTGLNINGATGAISGTIASNATTTSSSISVTEMSSGGSRTSITTFTWAVEAGLVEKRINAGGAAVAADPGDPSQVIWEADTPHATLTANGSGVSSVATIPGYAAGVPTTVPADVGRFYRFGVGASPQMVYTIPTSDNQPRKVRLFFNETSSNTRTFNVLINGTVVTTSYNIYGAAGNQQHVISMLEYTITPVTNTITITFAENPNVARVSAIEIVQINQAPTLNPINDATVAEGSTLPVNVTGTNPAGGALTFSFNNAVPAFISVAATGNTSANVNIAPGYADAGAYIVEVKATASNGLAVVEAFQVTVLNTNRAPQIFVSDLTMNEGATTTANVEFFDEDNQPLTLSTSVLPAFGSFDAINGILTFAPTYNDAGIYPITAYASDGIVQAGDTFTLTVINIVIAGELTLTPGMVRPIYNTNFRSFRGIAGESLVAGDVARRDRNTGRVVKANATTAIHAKYEGFVVNNAVAGQPVVVQDSGDIMLGLLVQGRAYLLATTPGKISGEGYGGTVKKLMGIARNANTLEIAKPGQRY